MTPSERSYTPPPKPHRWWYPKILWLGWHGPRKIWFSAGNKFMPDIRELGIGPVSFVWVKWGSRRP